MCLYQINFQVKNQKEALPSTSSLGNRSFTNLGPTSQTMTTKVATTSFDTQPIVELERRCKVHGCSADNSSSGHSTESHCTVAHICTNCGGMAHGRLECGSSALMNALLPRHFQCFVPIAQERFGQYHGKVWLKIYAGMGCYMYAKRSRVGGAISLFFLHSDAHGQCEGTISDVPRVLSFVEGHYQVAGCEH